MAQDSNQIAATERPPPESDEEATKVCDQGHDADGIQAWCNGTCDRCGKRVRQGERIDECKQCDPTWWSCSTCSLTRKDAAAFDGPKVRVIVCKLSGSNLVVDAPVDAKVVFIHKAIYKLEGVEESRQKLVLLHAAQERALEPDDSLSDLGDSEELTLLLIVRIAGLEITGHRDVKYNGFYARQDDQISGKNNYLNEDCGVTLYFFDGRDGGTLGWHLDDRNVREHEGLPNWYNIGWLDFEMLGQYKSELAPPEGTHDFYMIGARALSIKHI